MRLLKKKTKVHDIGDVGDTPEDVIRAKKEAKRDLRKLADELIDRTGAETELIRQHLGIDDKGFCLRHPNRRVTDAIKPGRRFETVRVCLICDSEIRAGGSFQRKSMTNVISALNVMIDDKRSWRKKTSIMYNGVTYDSDDDDDSGGSSSAAAGGIDKKYSYDSSEDDDEIKDLSHMLNFYSKEAEEKHAAKARRKQLKKKGAKVLHRKKKKKGDGADDDDDGADDDYDGDDYDGDVLSPEDAMWKEEVKQRVAHVRAWDGNMALKQNPVYAKYFRMKTVGIPMQAITISMESDGLDPRIMDLDANRPLQDQVDDIPGMDEKEREKLRRNDQLAFLRDDDVLEPLTIDEAVGTVHRAYERRAYFMRELEEEKNPDNAKLSAKLWNAFAKPARPPPPPLPERKLRTDAPLPKLEEEEGEEEEEKKRESETPTGRTSRVSFSEEDQVTSADVIDVSLRSDNDAFPIAPILRTPAPGSSPPPAIAAAPDDALPEFRPGGGGRQKKRQNAKRPFKRITRVGTAKYSLARGKEELAGAEEELARRAVITGSLESEARTLEDRLGGIDARVATLREELRRLNPNDPLLSGIDDDAVKQQQRRRREHEEGGGGGGCPSSNDGAAPRDDRNAENRAPTPPPPASPFKTVDRSDVVKARMSKLPILPRKI